MADDNAQERQQRPTPKRLREARERGQVPRSRELNTTLLLVTSASAFMLLGPAVVAQLRTMMQTRFQFERTQIFDPPAMTRALIDSTGDILLALAPLLALLLAAAVLAPLALGGWAFSVQAISFKSERINPLAGLKRMFAARGWVELGKALLKFLLLAGITGWLLWHQSGELLQLGHQSLPTAMAHGSQLLTWSFLVLCAGMVLIAVVDVPFQRWDHERQLRMTQQELREELKDTEGKPEVRAQLRKLQRQMAQSRMMAQVPKADVILTNPTHVAVALRYDPKRMRAPRVVAKGAELIAAQIRMVAAEHNVPIVSMPPLARALYRSTELNDEIPVGLYLAVAQVLTYVFQLRAGVREAVVPDVEVPPEFRSR